MISYLHFGFGNEPRQTVEVETRITPAPRSGRTRSGYGCRIPTDRMVKWAGRWRRVYIARWGNAGSAYIGKPRIWIATVSE